MFLSKKPESALKSPIPELGEIKDDGQICGAVGAIAGPVPISTLTYICAECVPVGAIAGPVPMGGASAMGKYTFCSGFSLETGVAACFPRFHPVLLLVCQDSRDSTQGATQGDVAALFHHDSWSKTPALGRASRPVSLFVWCFFIDKI
jgi:hypothetical protein